MLRYKSTGQVSGFFFFFFSCGAQLWQQSFKGSHQYPFYARARCPASSSPTSKKFIITSVALLKYLHSFLCNWWEKRKWIDTFIRSGCCLHRPSRFPPPKLSSGSTCPHSWLDELAGSVTWAPTQAKPLRWWVGLVVAWQHTPWERALLQWQIKKKEPFVSNEPNPSQGAKLCSNFWTPSSSGYIVMPRTGMG